MSSPLSELPKTSNEVKPTRVRGRQRPTDHKTGPKGKPMTPIPSATLVVLCPRSSSGGSSDAAVLYDTLMVQRSARDGSSFRSAVVFPGGALDVADEEAIDAALAGRGKEGSGERASTTPEGFMLSLKLCALRETFEETGLLLVPSASPGQPGGIPVSRAIGHEEARIPKAVWDDIRDEVHNDAVRFVPFLQRIAKTLGHQDASTLIGSSLPALAPMVHHSNWITPRAVVRPAKRFDARFFVTTLDVPDAFGKDNKTLALSADGSETLSLRLGTPREIIDLGLADQISLFPPQFYILADLEAAVGPDTTPATRRFQPLIFAPSSPATYTPAAEYRITPIEEEQRGLTGSQNFSWDRTDNPSTSTAEKTSWVGDTQPPLHKQRNLGPEPDRIDPQVTVVEPRGLPKQGAMVSLGRKKESEDEGDEDDTPFVFPLVLPGDWQASPSQQRSIRTAFSVPSSGASPSEASFKTETDKQGTSKAPSSSSSDTRPLNRLYVSPRPPELGGGMTVRGCVRRNIGSLQDFQIGIMLQDKTVPSNDGDDNVRKAKM